MDEKTNESKVDLDSLLDEALEDFNKPLLSNGATPKPDAGESTTANEWTEEFIQEATKNFEKTMRHMMESQNSKVPGSNTEASAGDPSIDFDSLTKAFTKLSAAPEGQPQVEEQDFVKCLSDTMNQLKKSAEDIKDPPGVDDLGKMLENCGNENSVQGMFSLMQSMLENLLSKEVLYEPIKDIVDKFPGWLAENRPSLSSEDFTRFTAQYNAMKEVTELFEKQDPNQSSEAKTKEFEEVLKQMQRLQDLGQPPAALMGEFSNPLDMNDDSNESGFCSLLGTVGKDAGLGSLPEGSQQGQDQCVIM